MNQLDNAPYLHLESYFKAIREVDYRSRVSQCRFYYHSKKKKNIIEHAQECQEELPLYMPPDVFYKQKKEQLIAFLPAIKDSYKS